MAEPALTKQEYRKARRLARDLKACGKILESPVRITNGYPGIWVSSSGEVLGWYGFDRMFEPLVAGGVLV